MRPVGTLGNDLGDVGSCAGFVLEMQSVLSHRGKILHAKMQSGSFPTCKIFPSTVGSCVGFVLGDAGQLVEMQSVLSRCGLAGVAMRSPLSKFHTRRGALWINCIRSLLRGGRVFGASHSGLAGPPAAGWLRRPAFGAGRLWRPPWRATGPPLAGRLRRAGRFRRAAFGNPRMIFN